MNYFELLIDKIKNSPAITKQQKKLWLCEIIMDDELTASECIKAARLLLITVTVIIEYRH